MPRPRRDCGDRPTAREIREAERVLRLHPEQQRSHPSALPANPSRLTHVNTYGALPEFYIDRPFICRRCGAPQIWKAADQKWYYEEAKGHVDAKAVECRGCRTARRGDNAGGADKRPD